MYPKLYREIRRLLQQDAISTPQAREIVRKSGARPGTTTEGTSESTSGALILSLPPVTPVGGCPREPIDPILPSDPAARAAFYEDVEAAEEGEEPALEDMREWLISFGLEDSIVMDGVMPRLRYDWDPDDVYTLTVDPQSGCPVEVDITPPADGLWEQYKAGDSRFTSANVPLNTGQDYRALVKTFKVETGEFSQNIPGHYTNMNATAISPYPECDVPGSAPEKKTHDIDEIAAPDATGPGVSPRTFSAVCYRQSFGTTPSSSPVLWLTNDALLDNPRTPEWSNTAATNGPLFGIISSNIRSASGATAGKVTVDTPGTLELHVETHWRRCVDASTSLSFTHECFAALRSSQATNDTPTDTRTYRQTNVIKEAPINAQTIDFSEDPASGETLITRYDEEFPTFDVVAVRMTGRGPSVPV